MVVVIVFTRLLENMVSSPLIKLITIFVYFWLFINPEAH